MSEPFVVRMQESALIRLAFRASPWRCLSFRRKRRACCGGCLPIRACLKNRRRKTWWRSWASVLSSTRKCPELRVLYGMALCVNLEVQDAMEELGEAVSLAPDSFIAHLKMGELWMRLRVCEKAADHTQQASKLAQNMAQSELARRQAATIRTMMREGIERGGYRNSVAVTGPPAQALDTQSR